MFYASDRLSGAGHVEKYLFSYISANVSVSIFKYNKYGCYLEGYIQLVAGGVCKGGLLIGRRANRGRSQQVNFPCRVVSAVYLCFQTSSDVTKRILFTMGLLEARIKTMTISSDCLQKTSQVFLENMPTPFTESLLQLHAAST